MATIFTPWGGAMNCSSIKDCIDNAIHGNSPGQLSTCVTFSSGDLPSWVPLGQPVCSCNINYARKGIGCQEFDDNNIVFILLLIPNMVLNAYSTYHIFRTFYAAYRLKLLNSGINKITLSLLVPSNLIASAWPLVSLWLFAGSPPWVYDINLVCASLCATVIVVLLLVLTLNFRQVLSSTRKLRTGSKGGIDNKQKLLVSGASAAVVVTMAALTLSGQNHLAARASVLFFLASFVLYVHAANSMRQIMMKSMSNGNETSKSNIKLWTAAARIRKCIFRVIAFILWFIPAALIYSVTTSDIESSSISTAPVAALASESLHFSVSCCVFWISQYSSHPILAKRNAVSSTTNTSCESKKTNARTEQD